MQRRAAQALEQLQQLVDDAAAAGVSGASALTEELGLLANLQPVGPPMTFSPGEFLEPVRGETTKGEKDLEVKGKDNPEMKRVVVTEPKPEETQMDGDGSSTLQHSPNDGNGKGRGSREAAGKGRGAVQNVCGDSGDRQPKNVVGNETPENVGHHGDERHAVPSQGVEGSTPSGQSLGIVVNPFWSPECKRDVLREAFRLGYDAGTREPQQLGVSASAVNQEPSQLGFSAAIQDPLRPGSTNTTPQKGYVEMDPIELFRLGCLPEAEEKFRQGLMSMRSEPQREVGPKGVCDGLKLDGEKTDGVKHETSTHCETCWGGESNVLSRVAKFVCVSLHLVHLHLRPQG